MRTSAPARGATLGRSLGSAGRLTISRGMEGEFYQAAGQTARHGYGNGESPMKPIARSVALVLAFTSSACFVRGGGLFFAAADAAILTAVIISATRPPPPPVMVIVP